MYMSKSTQRLLAQQQKGQKASQQSAANLNASNASLGASADTSAALGVGRRAPRVPVGTAVPSGHLPVRHQKLEGDPDGAAGENDSAIPTGSYLDAPLPLAAANLAANNQLATRATRSDASETVVRTADSPLLLGPVASKSTPTPAPAAAVSMPRGRPSPAPSPAGPDAMRRTAPSPTSLRKPGGGTSSVPPRPPSQQTGRPSSAAVSNGDVLSDDATAAASAGPVDFASELEEIGRQLKAEQGNARSRHRAALAHAHQLRQTLSSTGPTPGPSPTPSRVDADAFDATDGTREEEPEGRTATGKPLHVLYTPDIRAKLPPGTATHSHVAPKPMSLRDYEMLAEACQRAGRARTESHAYYKIGELLSAKAESRPKAVAYFKRYLNLSRRLNDLQGEAKALNCLGVVHHEMGGDANLRAALDYHQQHAAIADAAGVFIANTNMGLAYRRLGDAQAALQCFKNTLKYAVRAGDRAAESLALANLGHAGSDAGDFATARVCVERHLEISATLQDAASSCEAHEQLGVLASQRGDYAAAVSSFTQALDEALREGDQDRARALRCQIGVAQGLLKAEQALAAKASDMGSGGAAL
uniref:MalT-like TPR region domain-containing protein n=1 Tax=Neobodo designis TaxID=312471 RepID=A0A7S1Q495_NEODS|mmetsp:Transcript_32510/g.100603  ORF Transcript_32510/g.100603 Transcript_32510/m.100603 type:complete len:588 (+) Transcript_32510:136-1899(+)|eukprot:CAMPEP_0174850176 /NCGR_PEP_ID=MMETSP1114-20130205/19082_1 /TAXON_ID=312471 /ORGANISM="Neobodo designis, Strain CCAP 1951/1" /LENGTH=587 /DNA_ID=CAMNT_0016084613 /DNA_START=136 /DNA_END=1899 /DNA_ORIENTATION=-